MTGWKGKFWLVALAVARPGSKRSCESALISAIEPAPPLGFEGFCPWVRTSA